MTNILGATLFVHLAFVIQTFAMAPARQRLKEGTGESLFLSFLVFLYLFCHFYLQVGGDIWKTNRVWINLSFNIDLQPEREHHCVLLLILYPEQIENALIGIQ